MSLFHRINNVLITGSAGFIGHHLGMRLLENGVSVCGVDNLNDTYDPSLKQRNLQLLRELSDETGTPFQFEELDLLDRSALSSYLDEIAVDAVVHAAAEAGGHHSMKQPAHCLQTNVQATSHLLEQVAEPDVERFLFVSSSAVYGNHDDVPYREELDGLEPVSTYGVSKRAAEMICKSYQKQHDLNTSVVRLFPVFGPRQRPDMVVHTFSRKLEQSEPLTVYGDGDVTRNFTYITDAIDGLCSALGQKGNWGVYNIAGKDTCTIHELVDQLGSVFDTDPEVEHLSLPESEQVHAEADLGNARRELDYEPEVSFEEGIERFADWFQNRDSTGHTSST
jgi:UDP-glucuronate 4-epimerase